MKGKAEQMHEQLNFGLVPGIFADKCRKIAAIGGFPFEGVSFIVFLSVGDFFSYIGFDFLPGFNIIE
jgi:hypothetical protein